MTKRQKRAEQEKNMADQRRTGQQVKKTENDERGQLDRTEQDGTGQNDRAEQNRTGQQD